MVICGYATFWNKKTTSSNKLLIPIDPNIEVLRGFAPSKTNIHALDNASSF